MSFVGIAPNYVLVLFLVGTAGLGSAAFHPPAFSAVVKASGSSAGGKMAMFVSGGNTGVFVGPVVAGLLVSMLGRSGTLLMLPVGLITALMLFKIHFKHETRHIESQSKAANTHLIALLAAVTAFRSIAISSAIYFLPLYFIAKGDSLFLATAITSLWLGVGVLGQLGGGYLSDRIGQRLVIVASLLLGALLFYGFLITSGYTSLALLAISGALLYASWAVIVVMSVEAAPSNIGAVSGFMLGFYVGIGGIAAAAFGALGDVLGLTKAFDVVAGSAFLGGLTALLLPKRIENRVSVG
jgi:FSR family fosmidomycin resistance protein-like MFS transporter